MITAMAWSICLPLLGAVVAYLAGRRASVVIGLVVSAGTCVASGLVGWSVWSAGAAVGHAVGGWGAPLGIELRADGLGAFMLLMTAGVGLGVSVYAVGYFHAEPGHAGPRVAGGRTRFRAGAILGHGGWREAESFWPLWLMLWASLNALFLSADLFNLYVTLEVMGLAAVALVTLHGRTFALAAAMRYLLATMLGSLAYLMGVGLLYGGHGVLDLYVLAGRVEGGAATWAAAGLMTAGLMLKTALFPLHFWLPAAHGNASAPVSAALSAVVVKASFYLLVRLWFEVFGGVVTLEAAQWVGGLGAGAVIWGSVQAIRQRRLKMLIAYSTVAQLGYLFVMIPLVMAPMAGGGGAGDPDAGPGGAAFDAWSGGMYHAAAHALAKASIFMAAGVLAASFGHDRIIGLRGAAIRQPMACFAFGLAGLNLIGLPPSAGFIAKWFLLRAAIETGQWWWGVVLLAGGLLAAMYLFRVFRHAFQPPAPGARYAEVSSVMVLTAVVVALAAMGLGMRAAEAFELLRIGAPG